MMRSADALKCELPIYFIAHWLTIANGTDGTKHAIIGIGQLAVTYFFSLLYPATLPRLGDALQ
jgi:hypothetical protein